MWSRNPLHTHRVKNVMLTRYVSLSLVKLVAVAGVLWGVSTAPAHAQQDIHSFVGCLNSLTTTQQTVADAVACVPSGCYTTVTMSGESAQPACTLRDGTRLPRVIYSCPGPNGSQTLRFRPSFTLCPNGNDTIGLINHIELGEDVNSYHQQKMADVDSPPDVPNWQSIAEFGTGVTAVVDTSIPANYKGCADCHDVLGTLTQGTNTLELFRQVKPAVSEGTIFTNDPYLQAPTVQTPLSDICTGIVTSTQLANNPNLYALEISLCDRLELKTH